MPTVNDVAWHIQGPIGPCILVGLACSKINYRFMFMRSHLYYRWLFSSHIQIYEDVSEVALGWFPPELGLIFKSHSITVQHELSQNYIQ